MWTAKETRHFITAFILLIFIAGCVSEDSPVEKHNKGGNTQYNCNATVSLNTTTEEVFRCSSNYTYSFTITNVAKKGILLTIDSMNKHADDVLTLTGIDSTTNANFSLWDKPENVTGGDKEYIFSGVDTVVGKFEMKGKANGNRSLTFHFISGCTMSMSSGPIKSPLYPVMNATVECDIQYNRPVAATVTQFQLAGKSFFYMNHTNPRFSARFSNTTAPTFDFIGDKPTFQLTLDQSVKDQRIILDTTIVDPGCSDMVVFAEEMNVTFPSGKAAGSDVECRKLIATPDVSSNARLQLTVLEYNMTGVQDILSVMDGGNIKSSYLAQVSAANNDNIGKPFVGTDSFVLISSSTVNYDGKSGYLIDVADKPIQMINVSKGEFDITSDGRYILVADKEERIILKMEDNSQFKLPASASFQVLDGDNLNSPELARFTGNASTFDVFSIGPRMTILLHGYNNKAINIEFGPLPMSSCNQSSTSFTGGMLTWEAAALCNNICSWNVKPNSVNESYNLVFSVTQAGSSHGMLNISALSQPNKPLLQLPTAQPVSVLIHALDGVILRYKSSGICDTGPLRAVFTVSQAHDMQVNAAPDSTFHVTSPLFPSPYPVGGNYSWHLENTTSFFVTFDQFDLLPGDTLTLDFNGRQDKLKGSTLPDDYLFSGVKSPGIGIHLEANIPHGPEARLTAYGFDAKVTALDCGDVVQVTFGKVVTLTNAKTRGKTCIYRIDTYGSNNIGDDFSTAVNFTIGVVGNKSAEIAKNVSKYFEIHDGHSVRDPLYTNLTLNEWRPTSSNRVIIRYPYSGDGTIFTINVTEYRCGAQERCNNTKKCMLSWWRCNGINDCGDNSDEMNCGSPNPGPTPTPTPAPPVSHGWRTAFWLCVPLALIIGIVCTKMAPVVQQRFRDRQYAQFHDLQTD